MEVECRTEGRRATVVEPEAALEVCPAHAEALAERGAPMAAAGHYAASHSRAPPQRTYQTAESQCDVAISDDRSSSINSAGGLQCSVEPRHQPQAGSRSTFGRSTIDHWE